MKIQDAFSSEFQGCFQREQRKREKRGAFASFTFRIGSLLMLVFFLSSSGQMFCHAAFPYWLSVKRIAFCNFIRARCYSLRQSKCSCSNNSSSDIISLWVNFPGYYPSRKWTRLNGSALLHIEWRAKTTSTSTDASEIAYCKMTESTQKWNILQNYLKINKL